ncbi:MAG: ABC transporter permease [Streptococcus sp.]|nr:ABC transporter permease [Streptococcus sp.]
MRAEELRHRSDLGIRGLIIIAKNEIIAFFRSKGLILSQFLQPILYVVFIIIGLNSSINNITYYNIKTSYAEYTIIGVIALLIIGQMTQVIYRVTIDKKYGLLALKLCSGVRPLYYTLGMSIYSILGLVVQEIVIYIITLIFGINILIDRFLYVIGLSIIVLLFWVSLAILITMFINDYRSRDIVIRFVLTPLGFTAPVFYIMDSAPSAVRWIGQLNPLTYQLDILRKFYFKFSTTLELFFLLLTSLLALVAVTFIIPKIKLVLIER